MPHRQRLFENLRMLPHAPGVQMQAIPEDAVQEDSGDEEEDDPNKRISSKKPPAKSRPLLRWLSIWGNRVFGRPSVRAHDKRIACEEEFSDSEDEGEGGRRNAASFKKVKRAKTEGDKEGEEKEKKGEEETKGIYSFLFFPFPSSNAHVIFVAPYVSCVTLYSAQASSVDTALVGFAPISVIYFF